MSKTSSGTIVDNPALRDLAFARLNGDIRDLTHLYEKLALYPNAFDNRFQATDELLEKCEEMHASIKLFRHDMKRTFRKKGAAA